MKFFQSITNKYTLIIILTIIFWIWSGLSFGDKLNSVLNEHEITSQLDELLIKSYQLENELTTLTQTRLLQEQGSTYFNPEKTEQLLFQITQTLNAFSTENLIQKNTSLLRFLKQASESSKEIIRLSNEYFSLLTEKGNSESGIIKIASERIKQWGNLSSPLIQKFADTLTNSFTNYLISPGSKKLEITLYHFEINKTSLYNNIGQNNFLNGQSINREEVIDLLNNDIALIKRITAIDNKMGSSRETGISGELGIYSQQLIISINSLKDLHYTISTNSVLKRTKNIVIVFILAGLGLLSFLFIEGKKVIRFYNVLVHTLEKLRKGEIPDQIDNHTNLEFNLLANELNTISQNLQKRIELTKNIGPDEKNQLDPSFGSEDILGNHLNELALKLEARQEKDESRKLADDLHSWLTEGHAKFNEIFRSERENEVELAYSLIKNLVAYIGGTAGSIFILKAHENSKIRLYRAATYAFDRRKFIDDTIELSEGLVGTCAIEKQTIFITKIPESYISIISSGLGEAQARCLLLVPLIIDNEIFGVIELASFKILKDFEINFTEQLAENIAGSLNAVRNNEKTRQLLDQSRQQAKQMEEQEEEMLKSMTRLQDAQKESLIRETEINGLMAAVNASSLVAEFSLNGRFAHINDKFVLLLDSPKENILGKHHSDFIMTDKYSEEYKDFWKRLRNGETIVSREKYKLFSGEEIWLDETFSPLRNPEGDVYKIFVIAKQAEELV